jgi:hypothetical protein
MVLAVSGGDVTTGSDNLSAMHTFVNMKNWDVLLKG